MTTELFKPEELETPAATPLSAMREELQRQLTEAIHACEEIPENVLDYSEAKHAFHYLAESGDAAWCRKMIAKALGTSDSIGPFYDRLDDYIQTLGIAFWRLRRAELRAFGTKGGRGFTR